MPGKLIICRGLPASGKTTWAKQFVQNENANARKAINIDRDMFRIASGFDVAPTGDFESLINQQQRSIIKHMLSKDVTVVESSTNLRMSSLRKLMELGEHCGAEVEIKDFHIVVQVAVQRDKDRGYYTHSVGEDVIRNMYNKFLIHGFPKIPETKKPLRTADYVPDFSKPKTLLVDIDGTIASVNGRSPYDYTLVNTDLPKQWVIDHVCLAYSYGYEIIFMSGRKSSCREATINWIKDFVDVPFRLFMRPTGDTRMDAVVKLELFDEHVRENYNVLYCLDDRKQVIDAYRAIGLKVMDVAGHDF